MVSQFEMLIFIVELVRLDMPEDGCVVLAGMLEAVGAAIKAVDCNLHGVETVRVIKLSWLRVLAVWPEAAETTAPLVATIEV